MTDMNPFLEFLAELNEAEADCERTRADVIAAEKQVRSANAAHAAATARQSQARLRIQQFVEAARVELAKRSSALSAADVLRGSGGAERL